MKALFGNELVHVFSIALGPGGDHPTGEGTGEVAAQVWCFVPPLVSKGSCSVTLLQRVIVRAFERSLQWFKGMQWEIWLLERISGINSVALSKLWLPNLLNSVGRACNNFEMSRQSVPYIKCCFIFCLFPSCVVELLSCC